MLFDLSLNGMNEIEFCSNYKSNFNIVIMGQPKLYGNHYATNVYPIMTSKNLFPILITLWKFFQNLLDDHNMFENKTNKKEKIEDLPNQMTVKNFLISLIVVCQS